MNWDGNVFLVYSYNDAYSLYTMCCFPTLSKPRGLLQENKMDSIVFFRSLARNACSRQVTL